MSTKGTFPKLSFRDLDDLKLQVRQFQNVQFCSRSSKEIGLRRINQRNRLSISRIALKVSANASLSKRPTQNLSLTQILGR